MGYDLSRFITEVDDEFICPICTMVLENGVQATKQCYHIYCDKCIKEWLSINKSCPLDRKDLSIEQFEPICGPFQNILLKLMIKCDFEPQGCQSVINLEALQSHIDSCLFNPKLKVSCDKECGLEMTQKEYELHNCTKSLANLVISLQKQVIELKRDLMELNKQKWISPNGLMVIHNIIECYKQTPTDEYTAFCAHQFAQSIYPLTQQNNQFNVELLEYGDNKYVSICLSYCYLNGNKEKVKYKCMMYNSHGFAYIFDYGRRNLREGPNWVKGDKITCGLKFNKIDNEYCSEVLLYFKRNTELFYEQIFNIKYIGLFPTILIGGIGTKVMVTSD